MSTDTSHSYNSPEFIAFVTQVGDAKSKQEEDFLVLRERVKRDAMIRLLYCEMLGHDCEFAYFKAIEYAADTNELIKRLGYMAAAICIPPDHEFRMMIVNQMCQDLNSTKSQLNVFTGLAACRTLAVQSFLQILMPPVLKLLNHSHELLRKKALMCLHRFYQIDASCLEGSVADIRKCLGDKDPSVLGASLHLIYELTKKDPAPFRDVVGSLVSILQQIKDHRLPKDYDYHRIPAPWIQMQLLRVLANIGSADQGSSEKMYPELMEVLKRADVDSNIGDAILYETIRTISKIYPNDTLLNASNQAIGRFLSSPNNNLKYLGINSLTYMVKVNPKYAMQYQNSVMDCLEDKDDSLKLKTLDLLFEMCNPQNLSVIVQKMFKFLEDSSDEYIRKDIVQRISNLAERFAPNPSWYITTMTQLFQLGGNTVPLDLARNMMNILAEGQGDASLDLKLRTDAAEAYLQLLKKPKLATVVEQLTCWIVGEYGHLSEASATASASELVDLFEREGDVSVRLYCLTALTKLCVSNGGMIDCIVPVIEKCVLASEVELQQRAFLLKSLMDNVTAASSVLTPGTRQEITVDKKLSMCDMFVSAARAAGAKEYDKPADLDFDETNKDSEFHLEAYAKPVIDPSTLNRRVAVKEGTVTMKSIAENKRQQNIEKGLSEVKKTTLVNPPPKQRNAGFGSINTGTFGKTAFGGFRNLGGKAGSGGAGAGAGAGGEGEGGGDVNMYAEDSSRTVVPPTSSMDGADLFAADPSVPDEASQLFSFGDGSASSAPKKKAAVAMSKGGSFGPKPKATFTPSARPAAAAPAPAPAPAVEADLFSMTGVGDFQSPAAPPAPSANDPFNFSSVISSIPTESSMPIDPFSDPHIFDAKPVPASAPSAAAAKKDPFDFNFF